MWKVEERDGSKTRRRTERLSSDALLPDGEALPSVAPLPDKGGASTMSSPTHALV